MKAICYAIAFVISIPPIIILAFAGLMMEKDYVAFYLENLNQRFIK